MSFAETGPSTPVTESIRVDKVSPRAKLGKYVRIVVILILAVGGLIPIVIMGVTSLKSRADIVSVPPKIVFEPTMEGFVFLLTDRSQLTGKRLEEAKANTEDLGLFDQVVGQMPGCFRIAWILFSCKNMFLFFKEVKLKMILHQHIVNRLYSRRQVYFTQHLP